jgi:hypothetical protein
MGRKSSIERLPLPVKKAIDDALKTGRFTIDEIVASVRQQFGTEIAPKRSTLGRYKQSFEEVGTKMREAREVAGVWAERLGSEPQGDIGKVVMELLRTMAFDATLTMSEAVEGVNTKELNALALAMQRLESAGKRNLEREKAIRQAAMEEAARRVDEVVKDKSVGLSDDAAQEIKNRLLFG